VLTALRATSYYYGEWQNRGYQNSKTPELIVTKFRTDDYFGEMTPQAKIQTDHPNGAFPANG